MPPTLPFWFKQRQCQAEPVSGEHLLKLSGPNLDPAYIHIDREGERWRAGLRLTPDGPDVSATEAEIPDERKAWEAAFELYRNRFVV
jgi:hypothetical protein